MEYCIAKPSFPLSKYVKQYWTIENCLLEEGNEHIQRIVPNGLSELIFYLRNKPISDDSDKWFSDPATLSGQLSKFYDIRVTGSLLVFSVLFKPHGLAMFFDLPVHELHDRCVPLRFVFKKKVDELENRLAEANSFAARIRIVEFYLLSLLEKKRNQNYFQRIEHSVTLINQSRGVANIDFLASEACLSRKQFERIFSYQVGTSPKQFMKIVRFQHVLEEKAQNKNMGLIDLTHKCGFYDQSHMINNFKELSGLSPKQYFNECEPYSDYFQ